MAFDYIVDHPCPPKHAFGRPGSDDGTEHILEMLKARNRAEAIRELAARDGKDPATLTVTVNVSTPSGMTQRPVTYAGLLSEARPLDEHASACTGCPANVLGEPYGCFGAVNYPVPTAAERWLFQRLQPPENIGGQLFWEAVKDIPLDGSVTRDMRAHGLFESTEPFQVKHKLSFFSRRTITSDQLLEGIFGSGGAPLGVDHCMGILLWLGAVTIDGQTPTAPQHAGPLLEMHTVAERQRRTRLNVGAPSKHPGIAAMQTLIAAVHRAWSLNCGLLVSA